MSHICIVVIASLIFQKYTVFQSKGVDFGYFALAISPTGFGVKFA